MVIDSVDGEALIRGIVMPIVKNAAGESMSTMSEKSCSPRSGLRDILCHLMTVWSLSPLASH